MIKHLISSELRFEKNSHSKFMQRRFDLASNLYSKDLKAHFSCVNAIEFSNSFELLASAGDDKRILIWNVNNDILTDTDKKPIMMKGQHNSNIFTLEFDNEDQKIFSGGNDHQVIVHDIKTQEICDIFLHENSVLGISVHPKQSCIFATACESGQISLYDLRCSIYDPIILASSNLRSRSYFSSDSSSSDSSSNSPRSPSIPYIGGAYNSCHFNPVDPNLLATANEITGVSLIDIRMNNVLLRYKSSVSTSSDTDRRAQYEYNQNVMYVKFNKMGTHLAALRAKQRPVIYELNNSSPVCFFDDEGFNNACTLKSLCFAGDSDQYLISGSDDFNVYIWKIPPLNYNSSTNDHLVSQAHLILKGHRSIVNQCRYNSKYHMLATSGVEKLIKVWCPYQIPGYNYGGLLGLKQEYAPQRKLYTFNDLFTFRFSTNETVQTSVPSSDPNDIAVLNYEPVIRNRSNITNNESTEEDRIMIAFFDSQVRRQRRIEETISKCLLNNKKKKKTNQQDEDEDDDGDDVSLILSNEEDEDEYEDDDDDDDQDSDDSEETSSDDSSSDSTTDDDDENDSDQDLDVNRLRRQYENKKNDSFNKKRKIISLRDRLRNLRHRQKLNLTQESDYINVLDSLNVSNANNESSTDSNELNEAKNRLISTTSIEIINGSSSNQDQIQTNDSSGNEALPRCSKQQETKELVKNLNKQKRKIELDEDNDNDVVRRVESKNDSSDDASNSIVKFKKNKSKKK